MIPATLRQNILEITHGSHVGVTKMKSVLRAFCFWPGMNADVQNFVRCCNVRTVYQKRADHPPLTPVAEKEITPRASTVIDLTGPSEVLDGKALLTVIDLLSRYPEFFILKEGSSAKIISCLKNVFARQGFPRLVISDNLSQIMRHLS